MTKELVQQQSALEQARKRLLALANRTTKALDSQRKRLTRDIERANKRAARARDQIVIKTERLTKTTKGQIERRIKKEIADLKETRAAALAEAKVTRAELTKVREDLVSAKDHLSRALHIDKAFAAVDKKLSGLRKKKASKKKVVKKKVARKKVSKKKVAKKAPRVKVAKKKATKRG
jgi:adenylate kinase